MLIQSHEATFASDYRWVRPDTAALEDLTARAAPLHAFLRPAWYRASHPDVVFNGFEANGRLIATFPLVERKLGPISVQEVAGAYWPFRSIPIAMDASNAGIAAMLGSEAARAALGKMWRLGPVQSDDPALMRLMLAAQHGGWAIFKRPISRSFDIDVAALQAKKSWPSKSAVRQSRNYANRLAKIGEVQYRHVTGATWTAEDRDAMAAIESKSWLAKMGDEADTKFLDPECRVMWETIAADPALAPFLFCSLVYVGGQPAAFTFGLEVGPVRYQIANNFNEEFKDASPGRIILTKDYADAAERGVPVINWGAGDAGYKARYGAEPGPEIMDVLFVHRDWTTGVVSPLLARRNWIRIGR